jgi:hypothetical protein
MATSEGPGFHAAPFSLPDGCHEGRRGVTGRDAEQFVDGGSSCGGIAREGNIALEFGKCCRCGISEDPIDTAGVEAQRTQTTLKFRDIVTPEHWLGTIEKTVPEVEARFNQRGPRTITDDPIDSKATLTLECFNGGTR